MGKDVDELTFRDLDENIVLHPPTSALEVWYMEVRDIKLKMLSVGQLARACRQDVFSEFLIPFCFKELEKDALAGEMYDGELVKAMKNILHSYWRDHPTEREKFLKYAEKAYLDNIENEGHDDWTYEQLHITEESLLN